MKINSSFIQQKYNNALNQKQKQFIEQKKNSSNDSMEANNVGDNQKLKKVVSNFSSIFIKKMFESMRDTLPDEKLIDGGFAEDVFTDMLDQKVSKLGADQNGFNGLNELLYRQLLQTQSNQTQNNQFQSNQYQSDLSQSEAKTQDN